MSSPFASHTKSGQIQVPWDPEHWIEVRGLTGKEVEAAEREHMRGVISGKSSRGWAKSLAMIFSGAANLAERDITEALSDPLAGVDRTAIVRAGLVSWSHGAVDAYLDEATKQFHDPIGDLQDEPLEFIAREVWRRTKPWVFQTAEERAAERKNG